MGFRIQDDFFYMHVMGESGDKQCNLSYGVSLKQVMLISSLSPQILQYISETEAQK